MIRKSVPDESELTMHLRQFTETFAPLAAALQAEVQTLNAMHQARVIQKKPQKKPQKATPKKKISK